MSQRIDKPERDKEMEKLIKLFETAINDVRSMAISGERSTSEEQYENDQAQVKASIQAVYKGIADLSKDNSILADRATKAEEREKVLVEGNKRLTSWLKYAYNWVYNDGVRRGLPDYPPCLEYIDRAISEGIPAPPDADSVYRGTTPPSLPEMLAESRERFKTHPDHERITSDPNWKPEGLVLVDGEGGSSEPVPSNEPVKETDWAKRDEIELEEIKRIEEENTSPNEPVKEVVTEAAKEWLATKWYSIQPTVDNGTFADGRHGRTGPYDTPDIAWLQNLRHYLSLNPRPEWGLMDALGYHITGLEMSELYFGALYPKSAWVGKTRESVEAAQDDCYSHLNALIGEGK